MIMAPFWQSSFVVPADAVGLFLEADDLDVVSVAAFETEEDEAGESPWWRVEMLHKEAPDRADLAMLLEPIAAQGGVRSLRIDIEQIPEEDWVERVRTEIEPAEIARFWIHGSHVEQAPPDGLVPIQIDAGLAFGSGEHATTKGCLEALDQLAKRRRLAQVLDMGCGSGVLAIAAAKCWPCQVLAVDNDPVAVDVAGDNMRINGVGDRVDTLVSEGYAQPLIRSRGPYDVILSNILADPLCEMARDLANHLAPEGTAILAGLLERQASQVIASHQTYGLYLRRKIRSGPWTILVMSRKKA